MIENDGEGAPIPDSELPDGLVVDPAPDNVKVPSKDDPLPVEESNP